MPLKESWNKKLHLASLDSFHIPTKSTITAIIITILLHCTDLFLINLFRFCHDDDDEADKSSFSCISHCYNMICFLLLQYVWCNSKIELITLLCVATSSLWFESLPVLLGALGSFRILVCKRILLWAVPWVLDSDKLGCSGALLLSLSSKLFSFSSTICTFHQRLYREGKG